MSSTKQVRINGPWFGEELDADRHRLRIRYILTPDISTVLSPQREVGVGKSKIPMLL